VPTLPRRLSRTASWLIAVAALLAVGATLRAQEKPGSPYGDLKEVTLRGRLVGLAEEMARKYGAKVPPGGKELALALPEGQLYTFLRTDGYRKLEESQAAGKPVEVRARLFPRSMLLEVLSFTPIAPESVQRRFYCDVCAIYMDDWGPCVCCGKEVEPVKDAK
jgi:hypothetical protein